MSENKFIPAYHTRDLKLKSRPLCGSIGYGSRNFLVAQDENEVTCQRCLRKMGVGRFSREKKLYNNFEDWFLNYIGDPCNKRNTLRRSLKEAYSAGFIAGEQ